MATEQQEIAALNARVLDLHLKNAEGPDLNIWNFAFAFSVSGLGDPSKSFAFNVSGMPDDQNFFKGLGSQDSPSNGYDVAASLHSLLKYPEIFGNVAKPEAAAAAWNLSKAKRAQCDINAASHWSDPDLAFSEYPAQMFECCVGNRLFSTRDFLFLMASGYQDRNDPSIPIEKAALDLGDSMLKNLPTAFSVLETPSNNKFVYIFAEDVLAQVHTPGHPGLDPLQPLPTDHGASYRYRTGMAKLLSANCNVNKAGHYVWKDESLRSAWGVATGNAATIRTLAATAPAPSIVIPIPSPITDLMQWVLKYFDKLLLMFHIHL